MTYSIVGYCEKEQAWGVAVQSKFLAVGSAVPFAKAGVGAIATQSFANTTYGPEGLRMIEEGKSADEVLKRLTEADEGRADRQVGIVDASGKSATFTGDGCNDWAGGIAGKHFAAQGNILVDGNTVKEMARVFETTEGPLAERLLRALAAGQAAGGDSRGMQSAALLVVKEGGGYGGFNDRYIDLRVDDHASPIQELERIYQLHTLYLQPSKPEEIKPIDDALESELMDKLLELGYRGSFAEAFRTYLHTENFEMREQTDRSIDTRVLAYLRAQ
ncbi:DUF1028 domain-containing protein [Exiguobacterium artemiae]|uniref:DUF1028 domain-containing protein n=1 Tax=Exiguobacterium artemiae TaxID=340145 RepID=UPI003D02EE15